MSNLSKSTQLVNCLIALSVKTPDFPHPLWNHGIQLETIEQRILLQDGSQVNPDVQFKKNDNYLLFFECKDGYCDETQLDKYKKLTVEDINKRHITDLPNQNLNFDIAYFGTKEKEDKLVASVERYDNPFPIIILGEKSIKINAHSKNFKNTLLNDLFSEITFERPAPINFIPFMTNDSDEVIKTSLLQHFMHKSEDHEFTLDDLLRELFPHVINYYSLNGRNELKQRVARLINQLMRLQELIGIINYVNEKYIIKIPSPRKFMKICIKLVESFKEIPPASKLSQWFGSED